MSPIVVHREHQLDGATARRMAETIAGRMRRKFGGTFDWDGDTLQFRRTGASGHVDLGVGEVTVHAYLDEHLGTATGQAALPAARRSTSTRSSRSQGTSRSERPK